MRKNRRAVHGGVAGEVKRVAPDRSDAYGEYGAFAVAVAAPASGVAA
jgi:hypothetical protein